MPFCAPLSSLCRKHSPARCPLRTPLSPLRPPYFSTPRSPPPHSFPLRPAQPIREHLDAKREEKKGASKDEKEVAKAEKAATQLQYGFALVDGHIEKMGNYTVRAQAGWGVGCLERWLTGCRAGGGLAAWGIGCRGQYTLRGTHRSPACLSAPATLAPCVEPLTFVHQLPHPHCHRPRPPSPPPRRWSPPASSAGAASTRAWAR